jgi:hypothetical protein
MHTSSHPLSRHAVNAPIDGALSPAIAVRRMRKPDAITPFLGVAIVVRGLTYDRDTLTGQATCTGFDSITLAGAIVLPSMVVLLEVLEHTRTPALYTADVVAALDGLAQIMSDDDCRTMASLREWDARERHG